MATYLNKAINSFEEDTNLYAKNINITDISILGNVPILKFEFLAIYKDASRWVEDYIPLESIADAFDPAFRQSLISYVDKQRRVLSNTYGRMTRVRNSEHDYRNY